MKQAILNNGIKMPYIGLGVFRLSNPKDAYNAVRSALDLGYRHIDTAKIYENEEAVGKAIKDSKVDRDEVFLTTKLWTDDIRKQNIQQGFELSLRKLQVDYIDLYLVHWPVNEMFVSIWSEMEKIYKTGKSRAIGVSNYQIYYLNELLAVCSQPPMVNQFEVHPYFNQEELITFCHTHNIQPVSYSPLCANKKDLLKNPLLIKIGKKYKKTAAQIVLRWNIERSVVSIPKSANSIHQAENLDIFDFSLDSEDMNKINTLNSNLRIGFNPDDFLF